MSARIGKPEGSTPSAVRAPVANAALRASFAATLDQVAPTAQVPEPAVPTSAQRIDEAIAHLRLGESDLRTIRALLAEAIEVESDQ